MATDRKTIDVFISHSVNDTALAVELANACRASGLEAVAGKELPPGDDPTETLWEALAESRAVVAVLSPSGLTPWMGIEIGAARAWNKPIFGVVPDFSYASLPPALADVHLYPASGIDDVVEAIKASGRQLSDEDRSFLATAFASLGVSVDQLALEPARLQALSKRFNAHTGKNIAGERLLSELLRMRKQGLLSRKLPPDRSRPHSSTA
jgi:hypothetical protein